MWLPYYEPPLPSEIYQALINISPATIDRLMAPMRSRSSKHGFSMTKPGSILKKQIPLTANQWDQSKPGFIEADTVAHCGSSTAGMFAFTINCVDIATTWTEQRAVWGKGEKGVLDAMKSIENNLPFELKGFDCDNGSEFLNWHLYRHFVNRNQPVQFTRSRPYHKNDNAHIEEKNWTHIRQYLGYQRFGNPHLVTMLNELYTTEWNKYFNFFIPSFKLLDKHRDGSKIIKTYDKPKTPYQRVLESQDIPAMVKNKLTEQYEKLNPFDIQREMYRKIKEIGKALNVDN